MKRILTIFLECLACTLIMISCKKDDADAFVGRYSLSLTENVVWGAAEATLNDNGVLMIQKESDSRVKVSGMYYTYGEVVENKLYMEGFSVSDEAGYLTYTFNEATLKGNVLTFTAVYTGKLSSGGILYPIRSVAHVTCIKQ